MKKFMIAMLATLCAAVLSVAVFAGCGGKKEGGTPSGGDNPPVTTPDEDDETTPGGEEDKESETPTYTEVLSDGGLTFRTTNDTTIVQNSCNNNGVWDDDKSEFVYTYWDLMVGFNWNYTTSLRKIQWFPLTRT